MQAAGIASPLLQLLAVVLAAVAAMALLGAAIAKYLVLPLRTAPPLNTLLLTLMLGSALRECVRLFYPQGANPKPFPRLLPQDAVALGSFTLRLDNVLLFLGGLAAIAAVHLVITRTRLGLAIRAVAQDAETARVMGIDFERIVLVTFALGSGLAAAAGVMNGLYYNEINFSIGLLLGVIGFPAAVVGGLVGAAVIGVPVLGRLGWLARVATSLDEHRPLGRIAIGVALVAVVAHLRDQHFAMLMVASVLFYTVACLGLTVQFGYAGVVNF